MRGGDNDCDENNRNNKHNMYQQGIYTPAGASTTNCNSTQQQNPRTKSIRWTKDQLRKIDNVNVDRDNSFSKNE